VLKASTSQTGLDGHLREQVMSERVLQYSDPLFQEAATEWLISTDQVLFV
jgi:hypothetical protein